jgi:hypothetical protein
VSCGTHTIDPSRAPIGAATELSETSGKRSARPSLIFVDPVIFLVLKYVAQDWLGLECRPIVMAVAVTVAMAVRKRRPGPLDLLRKRPVSVIGRSTPL